MLQMISGRPALASEGKKERENNEDIGKDWRFGTHGFRGGGTVLQPLAHHQVSLWFSDRRRLLRPAVRDHDSDRRQVEPIAQPGPCTSIVQRERRV